MASTSVACPDEMALHWRGPFAWPRILAPEGLVPLEKIPEPRGCGVYLETAEFVDGGFLIRGVGITKRPFAVRFRDHHKKYLTGFYTILDPDTLKLGIRQEIWHGFFWKKHPPPEKAAEYLKRRDELRESALRELRLRRIFVAHVADARHRARIEAAIFQALYKAPPPFCNIPDKGVQLAPRWKEESPITIENSCDSSLHGLPRSMII